MMEEHWTDRLSEYLDGELSRRERAAADRHLAACPECAGVLAELRSLVATAGLLPDAAPARDLWPGIQARLAPRPVGVALAPGVNPLSSWRRRVVVSVPQLAAAGLAVMVFSAAAAWLVAGGSAPGGPGVPAAAVAASPHAEVVLAGYEPAMADLESEYERRRDQLDPETILVVERNLAIIDAAIREAQEALGTDPSSGFLNAHLAETVRRRMTLLREVASI
jgi:hypothetical protein